ncbi:MAG: hypothetical protein ACE5E6_12630 [Phycisphaerae bacterium]
MVRDTDALMRAYRNGEVDVHGDPITPEPVRRRQAEASPKPARPKPPAKWVPRLLAWLLRAGEWDRPLIVAIPMLAIMACDACLRVVYRLVPLSWQFLTTHVGGVIGRDVLAVRRRKCDECEFRRVMDLRVWCGRLSCSCPRWYAATLRWRTRLRRFKCPAGKF